MPTTWGFTPGKLREVLGYDEQDADELEASGLITAPVRFAVLGKALARYGGNGFPDHLWIVHAWGVHMGDKGSSPPHLQADLRYVAQSSDQAARVERCIELMRVNAALIKRAIQHVLDTDEQDVLVMWNGLGFGSWLDNSVVTNPGTLREYWAVMAKQVASDFNGETGTRVLVWRPTFGDGNKTDAYFDDRRVLSMVTRNADPCGGFVVGAIANASKPRPPDGPFSPANRAVLVVNAWDDWSFIGNGGVADDTLDGWVVTGGAATTQSSIERSPASTLASAGDGMCWQAASTAFMHNLFFTPVFADAGRKLFAPDCDRDASAEFRMALNHTLDAFRAALPERQEQ